MTHPGLSSDERCCFLGAAWGSPPAAPGGTGATIQKKSVTGPAVALMVNPLECDLLLDKTCCVPSPPSPGVSTWGT